MSGNISELYTKYTRALGPALDGDGYYDYLLGLIKSGNNVLSLNSQILHKLVDEEWLLRVEDALDALYLVTREPRRFVTTAENVVPVELAKKITAESVRHLSQNTQFITPTDDDSIRPSKILNVSVEDTYNLYENRFLYHLILRLSSFVEQRCDIILQNLGDETTNVFTWNGNAEDGAEAVELKLEMKLHNKQQAELGNIEDTDIYKRMDRVRRLVSNLKRSNFCDVMKGCTRVRNPIQRTNLMIKDRSYRKCYDLWYFLDAYDKQGYTIEVENKSIRYSEDYLEKLYQNFIGTYSIFKSVLAPDNRNLQTELQRKLRFRNPRFITKLKEEKVESRDLEDVEIRRIFVDEVTPAQIEAEEKLAEETARRIQLEKDLAETLARAEKAEADLAKAIEEARKAAEEAARVLAETKAEAERVLTETKQAAEEKYNTAMAEAERELAVTKAEAARVLAETKTEDARILAETKAAAEKLLAETKQADEEKYNAALQAADTKFNSAMAEANKRFEDSKAHAKKQMQELKDSSERNMLAVRKEANEYIDRLQTEHSIKISRLQSESERRLEEATAQSKKDLAEANEKFAAATALEASGKKLLSEAGAIKAEAEAEVAQARKSKRWAEHAYADLAVQLAKEQKLRKALEDELAKTKAELENAKANTGFLGLFRRR